MPIRVYEPLHPPCRLCGAGFERVQRAGEPALESCPRCGQPVRLRAAPPAPAPRVSKKPSVSDAKSAGFTVLKRTPGGEYEKQ